MILWFRFLHDQNLYFTLFCWQAIFPLVDIQNAFINTYFRAMKSFDGGKIAKNSGMSAAFCYFFVLLFISFSYFHWLDFDILLGRIFHHIHQDPSALNFCSNCHFKYNKYNLQFVFLKETVFWSASLSMRCLFTVLFAPWSLLCGASLTLKMWHNFVFGDLQVLRPLWPKLAQSHLITICIVRYERNLMIC